MAVLRKCPKCGSLKNDWEPKLTPPEWVDKYTFYCIDCDHKAESESFMEARIEFFKRQ